MELSLTKMGKIAGVAGLWWWEDQDFILDMPMTYPSGKFKQAVEYTSVEFRI